MPIKSVARFLLLLLAGVLFWPADRASAGEPNLLSNAGFELGSGQPAHWAQDAWSSDARFDWSAGPARSPVRSVHIACPTPNDARWIQSLYVRPFTPYRLSGWIKTSNVTHTTEYYDAGANLSLLQGPDARTPALFGTRDWTYVEVIFDTGTHQQIVVAARLGTAWGSASGEAWFDDLRLEPVPAADSRQVLLPLLGVSGQSVEPAPSWKILALVYDETDVTFTDRQGHARRLVASLSAEEQTTLLAQISRFATEDVPALTSGAMRPSLTVLHAGHPLRSLTPMGCDDYAPSPIDAGVDRPAGYDSVIALWDGGGADTRSGQPYSVHNCAWAWDMGRGQTYNAIGANWQKYNHRNVFKHEWGHSIVFYYDATDAAPKPAVDNHINDTTTRYVHCGSGQEYILEDESDDHLIPNSIFHNAAGFTHDYYSGLTATPDRIWRCLGIPAATWATGGPVTRPANAPATAWQNIQDDTIGEAVPLWPAP